MSSGSDRRELTVMLVPDGRETKTVTVSYTRLRALAAVAATIGVLVIVMAGSWWFLAARAVRVAELEREVEVMTRDRARVEALVQRLESIEGQYGTLRGLFGAAQTEQATGVWLPPTNGERRGESAARTVGATLPSHWPLTERGFVTQGLHGGSGGPEHPGLDVAVATGSYIRAAGGGTIVDVGEDAIYGRFVLIDHGEGHSTLYGHASETFVTRGQTVRERQVIALSGSTGRSTGPHLHFEVLVDGEPVDPLAFVTQPG